MKNYNKVINIIGKKWFDKINGNTYHSVTIEVTNDGQTKTYYQGLTYGYGDQWQYTAIQLLKDKGVLKNITRKYKGSEQRYTIGLWQLKARLEKYGKTLISSYCYDVNRKKDL